MHKRESSYHDTQPVLIDGSEVGNRLGLGACLPRSPPKLDALELIRHLLVVVHPQHQGLIILHQIRLEPLCLRGRALAQVVLDGRVAFTAHNPPPHVLVERDLNVRVEIAAQSLGVLPLGALEIYRHEPL